MTKKILTATDAQAARGPFREPYPAPAAIGVAALPRGALVEVECFAAL